jgi:GH15 family glucan-1,4-alpha-glucosidase
MNKSKDKLSGLVEKSKEVFAACQLPNGCLVAAPVHESYYPLSAKNYFYIWPGRDTGFALTGALYLGVDLFDSALRWVWERAEGYKDPLPGWESGILFRKYHPNGRLFDARFQPDQTGTLLWAICEYGRDRDLTPLQKQMLEVSANGLCALWDNGRFNVSMEDLWEESSVHPRLGGHITYSLAACSCGLKRAHEVLSRQTWLEVANEMQKLVLKEGYDKEEKRFLRKFGGNARTKDANVDASLLGLVWPFEVIAASDAKAQSTASKIIDALVGERGVHRYQFDDYDGEVSSGRGAYRAGGGEWPLISFWLTIVLAKMGRRNESEQYFWSVLDNLDNDLLIPEQFFPSGDPRVGVKPLLWSHSMFAHAAHELGFL